MKAVGHEACRRGYEVLFRTTQRLLSDLLSLSQERRRRLLRRACQIDLLILNDFAFRKLDAAEAELLYVIAEERIGAASTMVTYNRPPQDWYNSFAVHAETKLENHRLGASQVLGCEAAAHAPVTEIRGIDARPARRVVPTVVKTIRRKLAKALCHLQTFPGNRF